MKYKSIIILALTIFVLITIAGVSAADTNDTAIASEDTGEIDLSASDDISVNNLETNENNTLTQANNEETVSAQTDSEILTDDQYTYSGLREQIGTGGNKNLTKGIYTYNNDGGTIKITDSGVINGNGAIIDMTGSNIQAFYVDASDVIIKNLTIKNSVYSYNDGDGGAIYFSKYSSLGTVENCNFINIKINGDFYGGAVCFCGSGTVTNCNFANNSALYGGAINFDGSGTVTNCTFTNNKATNYWGDPGRGGAIRFGSISTITNCTFTNNTATERGGAIYYFSHSSNTYEVKNCNFTNNSASYGGAVYFYTNSEGSVTNCNFTDNRVTGDESCGGAVYFYKNTEGNVTNCSFNNNSATKNGGAIYFDEGSNGRTINCNFTDNSANSGGAIFSWDWYTAADTCIFKRNSGDNVNVVIYPPTLNVDNFTTFYGSGEKLTFNLTTNSGIPVNNGNISISVYFKDNGEWVCDYSCLSGEGWSLDLPIGSYYAIFNTSYEKFTPIQRTITVTSPPPKHTFWALNNTINANDNETINLTNDFYFDLAYDSAFVNGIVINRPVTINGNGCTINANGKARIFQVKYKDVVLKDINFINANIAGNGGAVNFVDRGNVTNCNFTGNNATSRGGAIFCNAVCFVTNCNFINNNATSGNGGALWTMAAKVVNCNFTDNFALHHGGACWIYSGIVSGSDFIGNDVVTGSGGALRFTEEGDVTNCNFTNNSAIRGGAVGFNGKGDLTNCNFNNNWAISDYGGAAYFYFKANVTNCSFADNEAATYGGAVFFDSFANVTNCNFVSNKVASRDGGAVCFNSSGALSNCNFAGNSAGLRGGAVYFYINSTVENCNFTGNTASNGGAIHTSQMCYGIVAGCDFANNSAFNGGAVNMYAGVIEDCNFANNTATNAGGAVIFSEEGCLAHCNFEGNTAFIGGAISMFSGNLNNCNFTGNNATKGSAINFNGFSGTNISNSLFLNNRANASATDAFNVTVNGNSVVIAFIGQNNLLNAIYSKGNISFTNVTYWGAGGIVNTGADLRILSPSSCEAGQNISVIGVVNGNIINATMITDENGRIVLENGSDYYLALRHDEDSYYTGAETLSTNMKLHADIASLMTTDRTVNITAKSNIYSEVMPGELIFILPNVNVTANYSSSGIWWAVYAFADYGVYEVNASYIGLDNVTVSNATIGVKIKTEVTADEVTATYNKNKNLVVTLRDANGNPLSGVKVTINLNGAKQYTTDANGQVKVNVAKLVPKTYTAKIIFEGNINYIGSSADVKVTVKKAKPKIVAKKKTYKAKAKVKKFTITLKDNKGKAIKNVKVRLMVKKITKKAKKTKAKSKKKKKKNIVKTNKKGKATFKIDRKKKGKYMVTVKFYGNKYFTSVTKKVKITVK